jgi:MOSC domain-containing protein YiiM
VSAAGAETPGAAAAGRVDRINISNGGLPKRPVAEVEVTADGLTGDWQQDRRHHGGPDRAVILFSAERIAALRAEGHPIAPGTIGENLTVSGLDWLALVPGAQVAVGTARLEITKYTTPCVNIAGSFTSGAIARVGQKANPGWSRVCARVLVPGRVRVGDAVLLLD